MESDASPEEQTRVIALCRQHLGGLWLNTGTSDVEIKKLSGGMSNLLYKCVLMKYSQEGGIHSALLRLYGQPHCDIGLQLEIFNQLAAENLGPKLYASFAEGRFEEYLDSSPLTCTQMMDADISEIISKKLAAIHQLNIENLKQDSSWILNCYNEYHSFIKNIGDSGLKFDHDTPETTKTLARNLLSIDYKAEIDYLKTLFGNSNSPLVFSHNDLHQNNILILNDANRRTNLANRIVFIDFEYSSQNYRGFDLANHLSEWCFNYNVDTYPFFECFPERLPSNDRQKEFLRAYVLASDRINHNFESYPEILNERVEALFDEMQPFLMASNLLWALWAIQRASTSKIKFGYWEMSRSKWDIYQLCKRNYMIKTAPNGGEKESFVQYSKM